VVPQRGVGHRVGHDRLDVFLAAGAIVAMDRVLGDDWRDLFGDVLDDALSRPFATLKFAAAAGAAVKAMLDLRVDRRRGLASGAGVPFLRPRLLAASLRRRLLVRRDHARRRGRRNDRWLQGGDMPGHRQREQRHRLWSQPWQRFGLLLRKRAALSRMEDGCKVGKMSQAMQDSRSFTRRRSVAQCLTSAEHCRRLKCYPRRSSGLPQFSGARAARAAGWWGCRGSTPKAPLRHVHASVC